MPNPTTNKASQLKAVQTETASSKSVSIPPLPKSLPTSYKAEWRALVQHMRDNDIWVPQKAGLVETYLMNLRAIREAEAFMQAQGTIMKDGKQNPASAVLVRHSATLNKLAEQLALGRGKVTPTAQTTTAKPAKSTWSA